MVLFQEYRLLKIGLSCIFFNDFKGKSVNFPVLYAMEVFGVCFSLEDMNAPVLQ